MDNYIKNIDQLSEPLKTELFNNFINPEGICVLHELITKVSKSTILPKSAERIKVLYIPNTVEEIDYGAFNECKNLTKIIFPERLYESVLDATNNENIEYRTLEELNLL